MGTEDASHVERAPGAPGDARPGDASSPHATAPGGPAIQLITIARTANITAL